MASLVRHVAHATYPKHTRAPGDARVAPKVQLVLAASPFTLPVPLSSDKYSSECSINFHFDKL